VISGHAYCVRNSSRLGDASVRRLLDFVALGIPLALVCEGCATPQSGKNDLLMFLDNQAVTRAEVLAHLGEPSASFEHSRVLTYRLSRDKGGYYVHRISVDPASSGWDEIQSDLVVLLDEQNVVQRFHLIQIHAM